MKAKKNRRPKGPGSPKKREDQGSWIGLKEIADRLGLNPKTLEKKLSEVDATKEDPLAQRLKPDERRDMGSFFKNFWSPAKVAAIEKFIRENPVHRRRGRPSPEKP